MAYGIWVLKGMMAWMATGIDDVLAVYALGHDKSKGGQSAIIAGTVFGTIVMFLLGLLVAKAVISITGSNAYLRLLGVFPIILGWRLFVTNLRNSTSIIAKTQPAKKSLFILAAVVYLSNSTDDLTVNSSLLVQTESTFNRCCLLAGNILGCLTLALLAIGFSQIIDQRVKHTINLLSGLTLMALGLTILSGVWN